MTLNRMIPMKHWPLTKLNIDLDELLRRIRLNPNCTCTYYDISQGGPLCPACELEQTKLIRSASLDSTDRTA